MRAMTLRMTVAWTRPLADWDTLSLIGVGILLPLALVVCYITRQSQYTNNNILQRTMQAFYYLTEQKNSLTTRHEQTTGHSLCTLPALRC